MALKPAEVIGAYEALRHLEKLENAKAAFRERGYANASQLEVMISPPEARKSDSIKVVMAGLDVGVMIDQSIKSAQEYLRKIGVEYEDARENDREQRGPRRGTQGVDVVQDAPPPAPQWILVDDEFGDGIPQVQPVQR